MSTDSYSFSIASIDASAAFDCEADRAAREGMKGTSHRQAATALHIRNAAAHMQNLCPEGYRVDTRITFVLVPNVNPVLRDEYRK